MSLKKIFKISFDKPDMCDIFPALDLAEASLLLREK